MQSPGKDAVEKKSGLLPWLAVAGFAALAAGELLLAHQVKCLRGERIELVSQVEAANQRIQELTERAAVASPQRPLESSVLAPTASIEARVAQLEQKIEAPAAPPLNNVRPSFRSPQPPKISEYNVNNPPPAPVEEPTPVAEPVVDNGKRSWGEEQALGAPDAVGNGDNASSWASKEPDAGPEWLSLAFEKPVDLAEVRIRENHNPGAISKVTAVVNGQEVTLWEGTAYKATDSRDFVVPVNGNIRSGSIIVHMDTARVPGWNEIDAVELVGRDGSRQWAANSQASSAYAQPRTAENQAVQPRLGFDYLNK